MAELLIIGYADVETADKALDTVRQLEREGTLVTGGAAVVRRTDAGDVEMVARSGPGGGDPAPGGYWGLLFSLLFLAPPEASVGGARAMIGGGLPGWSGGDDLRSRVTALLRPGTGALALYVATPAADAVLPALAPLGGAVIRAPLAEEAAVELQHAVALATRPADERPG